MKEKHLTANPYTIYLSLDLNEQVIRYENDIGIISLELEDYFEDAWTKQDTNDIIRL